MSDSPSQKCMLTLLNYVWAISETFILDVAIQMGLSPTSTGLYLFFLPISTFLLYSHGCVLTLQADFPGRGPQCNLVLEGTQLMGKS